MVGGGGTYVDATYRTGIEAYQVARYACLLKTASRTIIPRKIFYFDKLHIVGADSLNPRLTRKNALTFRLGGLHDIERMAMAHREPAVFERRIKKGCTCFLAEAGNAIAGMIWARFGEQFKTNCEYIFTPGKRSTWIFDAYIVPEYRLRGVFTPLMSFLGTHLRLHDSKGVYGEIHHMNRNSLQSHLRLGFSRIETISYIQVFGLFIYLIAHHRTGSTTLISRYVSPFRKDIRLFGGAGEFY